ncbi:TPA: iron-regulated protein A [Vibrio vulnificus]|nr:iron-regulated protein A [Vibrio vulnificus]
MAMKTIHISLAMGAALLLVGCQSTTDSHKVSQHRSDAVFHIERAAAATLAQETTELVSAFVHYCQLPEAGMDTVKKQWHRSMLSWMALQGQERGPAAALEQSWNVQFWPDKKNTTGRKMSALIQQNKTWKADDIAVQSVTVQGLGAIEWLLYDESSDLSRNAQTCQTGVAISRHLNQNTQRISDAWSSNPWASLNEKEWHSEYISLLSNQLEYAMKKLSRPLANIGQPRPYFSESWRSQTSLSNLKANVEALKLLYLANGEGLDATLRGMDKAELADRVVNQFDVTLATWPEQKSLFAALQDKEGYRMALTQLRKLEQLKYLIHDEVAVELGVVIGFNATDGD